MKRARPVALLLTAWLAAPLSAQTVAFTGATIWDGTGAPPVRNATLLVEDGRVTAVGADVQPPEGADVVFLGGKFVLPGMINTHGHVSGRWAPADVTDPAERVREDLRLYARYGVTTVNSLGDDATVLGVKSEMGPRPPHARLLASGPVIAASDPAGARAAAEANADAGADWLKLRVDDNLGTTRKMPWDAVQAVIDVADERGLRVATHLFYEEDAARLLEMGTGMIAHSVRDKEVERGFVQDLMASGVCYVPTLVREVSTFVYASTPAWFEEDFFLAHADSAEIVRLSDPAYQERVAASESARGYRRAFRYASLNVHALSEAGAPVAFGTDSGPAARFPGFFEHLELSLLIGAGLSTEEAMRTATGIAAQCLGLEDVGTLEPGKWADFAVYGQDPLLDIVLSRTLEAVYVAGNEVR